MVDHDVIARLERLEAAFIAHDGRLEHLDMEVAELRGMGAMPDARLDGIRWRRWMLRRLKQLHFKALSISAAAGRIALAWAAFDGARPNVPPERWSRDWFIAELGAQGQRPLSKRQIIDDLGPD